MSKLNLILTLFTLSLLVTSCFEVSEEVEMNLDGSGNIKMLIDLSASKYNLKNFMKVGEVQGQKIPSQAEIEAQLDELYRELQTLEGISNISEKRDFENFIFSIQADFSNITSLNKAINRFVGKLNSSISQPIELVDNFGAARNSFRRFFNYPVSYVSEEEFNKLSTMERFMFDTAKFIQIYRFEKEVKRFSNAKASLSPSGKAVKVEHKFADLIMGNSSIEHDISF